MTICLRGMVLLCIILPILLSGCSDSLSYSKTNKSIVSTVNPTANESVKINLQSPTVDEKSSLKTISKSEASPVDKNVVGASELEDCRSGLSSLSLISRSSWIKRRAQFDALLRNASVYARVRGDVDTQTRDTLDPLYQYRTRQLCLRIQQDVTEGLMRRAESLAGQ